MDPPAWLDEVNFGTDGPPWLSMGLSRGTQNGWLVLDERRETELAERRRLLQGHHDEVFGALPGTEAAGAETLTLVRAWFDEHRPDIDLPERDPDDIHPLEAAGRLTQEDLCIMVARDGAHHLDAACLCFPSHWRLADKLGRPARAVHGPVPHYEEELAAKVDTYLSRLRPGAIGVRRNWSIHDSPALFAPEPPADPDPVEVNDVGGRLWLRSERQTLRGLETPGAVLFTIRVQQAPFSELAAHPATARRLAARISGQPAELTAMNGLTPHREAVLTWLGALR